MASDDGRKVAKAKGVKFGRKPKLSEHQQREARKPSMNGRSTEIDALRRCAAKTR